MQVNNQSWQGIDAADFDRILRAAGGSIRLVRGDGSGLPATAGIGLQSGESVTLDAGAAYAARAWLTASATVELL